MNLADVMEELAAKLSVIDGLNVFAYPPDAVPEPAAIVGYPETIDFDQTYVRGADRMTLPVLVVVGKYTDVGTRDLLAKYCNGSGPASVKVAIESAEYSSCDSVVVTTADFDVLRIGGTDYMAALFTLDITGSGES